MHVCRVAWQGLGARLATAASAARLLRGPASLRQMSSGSFPGSSGGNVIYFAITSVAFIAGGYYAYRTVTSDKERYSKRIHALWEHNRAEWKPKPWPPQE